MAGHQTTAGDVFDLCRCSADGTHITAPADGNGIYQVVLVGARTAAIPCTEKIPFRIRDFRLPLRESSVRLRQIILGKQSERITSKWLVLYDHGYRSDTWFYRADPDRTDHKMLPNYRRRISDPLSDLRRVTVTYIECANSCESVLELYRD